MLNKKKYLIDIFLISIIIISILYYFRYPLFYNYTLFGWDFSTIHYPLKFYGFNSLKNGTFPLWTDKVFCGYPYFASGEHGLLYPINIIFFFFPTYYALSLNLVFHLLLICLTVYFYLRYCKINHFFSLLGAFTIIQFYKGIIPETSCLNAISWFGILLYLEERMLKDRKVKHLILFSIILTISLLTGHTQYVYLICLLLLFYGIFLSYFTPLEDTSLRSNLQQVSSARRVFLTRFIYHRFKEVVLSIILVFSCIFISLGLSSIQIVPQYELFKFSQRWGGLPYSEVIGLPGNIIKMDLPSLLPIIYLFGLIFISFIAFLDKKSIKPKVFILVLLISLFIFLCPRTSFYKILYKYLPFYKSFRRPDKILHIFSFLITFLVMFSFNYIFNLLKDANFKKNFKILIIVASITTMTLIILLPLKHFSRFQSSSLPLSELSRIDGENVEKEIDTIYLVKPSFYNEYPDFIKFLKKDKTFYRILNYDWAKGPIKPNLNMAFGMRSFEGHFPLNIKEFNELTLIEFNPLYNFGYLNRNVGNLCNVKYLLTKDKKNIKNSKLVYQDKYLNIYENLKIFPQAFLVHNYKVIKNPLRSIEKLKRDNFNPKSTILVEEYPPLNILEDKRFKEKFKIVNYSEGKISLKVSLNKYGFLVLSDTFYPGWKVFVNEKEEKIYRAYGYLKSIFLGPGNYSINFVFSPNSFYIGLGITIIFYLLLVYLFKHRNEKIKW